MHSAFSRQTQPYQGAQGLCIYCAKSGHLIAQCLVKPRSARLPAASNALVSDIRPSSPQHRLCLPAFISYLVGSVSVGVLVDSGADDIFINREFTQCVDWPLTPINCPRPVKAVNNSLIESVTHQIATLSLTVSGNHREHITFLVISSPSSPVVLGLP